MTITQLFKCGSCVNIGNNKNNNDSPQRCVLSKYNLLLYKKDENLATTLVGKMGQS